MLIRTSSVVACLLLSAPRPCWASDSRSDRATLKGVTAMNIVIEDLSPGVERNSLTRSQLQTSVELQLRQSGIRVDDTAPAYLYVAATSVLKDGATYVYSIDVEFYQSVVIFRTGERATASTWSTS